MGFADPTPLSLIWTAALPVVTGGSAVPSLSAAGENFYIVEDGFLLVTGRMANSLGVLAVKYDPATGEPLALDAYRYDSGASNWSGATWLNSFLHSDDNCVTIFGYGSPASDSSAREFAGIRVDYDTATAALTPGTPVTWLRTGTNSGSRAQAVGNGGPDLARIIHWEPAPLSAPQIEVGNFDLAAGTFSGPTSHGYAAVFGGSYNRATAVAPAALVGDHGAAALLVGVGAGGTGSSVSDTFIVSYSGGVPSSSMVTTDPLGAQGNPVRDADRTFRTGTIGGVSARRKMAPPGTLATVTAPADAAYSGSPLGLSPHTGTGLLDARAFPPSSSDTLFAFEYDPDTGTETGNVWSVDMTASYPAGTSTDVFRFRTDGQFWWSVSTSGFYVWGAPMPASGWRVGSVGFG